MNLSILDKILWLTCFAGQLLLLAVLFAKKRFKVFPAFTALVTFESSLNIVNYVVLKYGSQTTYFWTYWSFASVDSLFQFFLVYEIAREVLKPAGSWVHEARGLFIGCGLLGALVAAALSFAIDPRAPSTLYAWSIRLDLFTTLLIAELVVAISFSAQRLGLQWRSWVMGLGQGLMLWVSVSLFVATAQGYWGWAKPSQYVALDHLRITAFILSLGYWCVVFWRNEPERKPISPETMKYLYALHADLAYDVARFQRKKK